MRKAKLQLLFVKLYRKKFFTDTVSWIIFFLMTIGLSIVYLRSEFRGLEPPEDCKSLAVFIISKFCDFSGKWSWLYASASLIKDGIFYTLFMMIPVYISILIRERISSSLKPGKIVDRSVKTVAFLIVVFVVSYIFSEAFKSIAENTLGFRIKFGHTFNVIAIFATSMIGVGLVTMKKAVEIQQKYQRKLKESSKLKDRLETTIIKDREILKIGSKKNFTIVDIKDILFIKGDGNNSRVYLLGRRSPLIANQTLIDFEENLKKEDFVRVHKSFLISKSKVLERKTNEIKLQSYEEWIPIGGEYKDNMNNDPLLGFDDES